MTDGVRPATSATAPWRRRWPRRMGGVAAGWAVGYTAFGVWMALAGVPALYHGPHPWPPAADWLIVAAAWSYLRRTRPVCLPVPAPAGTGTPDQRGGAVGSTKPDS